MDDYSRKTICLLLERYPEYLREILSKLGIDLDVSKASTDSISAAIADRKQAETARHESSIYVCKCGSKSVVTREVQTRSADEGSTIVHICTECGKSW